MNSTSGSISEAQLPSVKQTAARLKSMFDGIWRMGDRDECSLKHVNHAAAALVCGKSWRDGVDYASPADHEQVAAWEKRLAAKWEKVEALYALVGRDRFLEAALTVPICQAYLGTYLERHSSDDLSPTERLTLSQLRDERRAQRRLDVDDAKDVGGK